MLNVGAVAQGQSNWRCWLRSVKAQELGDRTRKTEAGLIVTHDAEGLVGRGLYIGSTPEG